MAQLTMTWFSGLFAGIAMVANDPMIQFQSGILAGLCYLAAWGLSK
jgi:hypothetical protein